jgi:lysophospholipase L1-like esterase
MLSCALPPPVHITFLGDSITRGLGASRRELRWTSQVARFLGGEERNLGIDGSTLQGYPPQHHVLKTGLEVMAEVPSKPRAEKAFLVVSYGFNDLRYASAQFSSYRYFLTLLQLVDRAQAKGYGKREVVIASQPWFDPAVFEPQYQNPKFYPWNGATRDKQASYRYTALVASLGTGTRFVDSFEANRGMRAPDTVHPSNAGHRAITQAMKPVLCQ